MQGISLKSILIYTSIALLLAVAGIALAVLRSTRTVLNVAPSSSASDGSRHQGEALAQQLQKASKALQAHFITAGGVDYTTLSKSPQFAEYLELVSRLPSLDLTSLKTREEKLSFWINLYNSIVIHAVVEFHIEGRVWNTPTFFEKSAYLIGGYRFSLNDIENGILRANKKGPLALRRPFAMDDPRLGFALTPEEFEPRIHFALNCASRSCPPIRFYQATKIDSQLDKAAKSFVEVETRIEEGRLSTSAIFKWYAEDFGEDLQAFLERYLSAEQRRQIAGRRMKIEFLPYNWGLNNQTD